MLRYALYARKSKEDKSGIIKSIKDQLDIWRSLAEHQDLMIVREYEENKTARIPGIRPIYAQMIRELRSGAFDGILVWHVNRLARNMEEAGALAQMLIDGEMKEIRTPNWTYRPGDNILPLLLEQGMSTQYSLDLSEAVTRGINSMVQDGGWPHQAKVGYLNARDPANPRRGVVVKDPERFPVMRRAFDLLLTGSYSIRHVVDLMNRSWGFKTRPTPTRPNSPLSYAAAYDIFHSPFYAGFTVHNGELRKGTHEPMLSIGEYNQLQDILRTRSHPQRRQHSFAYTGLMRCGFCGSQVTAERRVKRGRTHIYYHCSDAKNRCTKKGITEQHFEDVMLSHLGRITLSPELGQIAQENLQRSLGSQHAAHETVQRVQEERLRSIELERKNLLSLAVKGLLSDTALYQAKDQELTQESNRLQLEVAAGKEALQQMRANIQATQRFTERARLAFATAGPIQRRQIALALGQEYILRGNDLTITLEPLLQAFSEYARTLEGVLEPSSESSQSHNTASFGESTRVGRDSGVQLEPPASLLQVLYESRLLVNVIVEALREEGGG